MRLRSVSLAALLAVIAPAAPVLAQTAAAPVAATTPQAAELAAAPVSQLVSEVDIPWTRFTLDNGLTVIVHEDRKAPVVAVSVWYNVGSKDEPAGSTGFAHLFEHLMFGGSENAPGSYLGRMRNLGPSNLNGTTWFDRTNYFQTVPTPALEQALFLEATAWAICSARSARTCSICSAAWSRTRSARATTSPTACSNTPSWKPSSPKATPIATRHRLDGRPGRRKPGDGA